MEKFNRFCEWFSGQLVLWVVAVVVLGLLAPEVLTPLKSVSEWFFALTMMGIGLVLSWQDFGPLCRKPLPVLLGTLAQFIIMPVLACAISQTLALEPSLALGLILAGAVPDAMAAGVISYLAGADVAFSVALTTLTTLVSPLATPALTYLFGNTYVPVPFGPMVWSILKMVILPLVLGLTLKHRFGAAIQRCTPVFPAVSTLFIGFICGLVAALNRDYLLQLRPMIFVAVALLNGLGLLGGYYAGRLFGFSEKYCRTLALGVGMQNAGLGAVLALKHFTPETAIPNVLFATWCVITASLLARFWTRRGSPSVDNRKT